MTLSVEILEINVKRQKKSDIFDRSDVNVFCSSSLSVNCRYFSAVRGSVIKIELLSLLSNNLQAIIRDYVGWSLTGNRKQKNMCNFWPKKWSRSLKK